MLIISQKESSFTKKIVNNATKYLKKIDNYGYKMR